MTKNTTKFHPILFATPMVQAILNGTKAQTRRAKGLEVINDNLDNILDLKIITDSDKTWVLIRSNSKGSYKLKCPYYVGDVFWVREKFANDDLGFHYYAGNIEVEQNRMFEKLTKWKPSIHMPKESCRIFLKVKSIRIERLQDISEEDAQAEGAIQHEAETDWLTAKYGFQMIWETIFGKESWKENPYVFVYEFEKIEKPLDFIV
jgi:hypothetical protein